MGWRYVCKVCGWFSIIARGEVFDYADAFPNAHRRKICGVVHMVDLYDDLNRATVMVGYGVDDILLEPPDKSMLPQARAAQAYYVDVDEEHTGDC
jgi:hypothetical protein